MARHTRDALGPWYKHPKRVKSVSQYLEVVDLLCRNLTDNEDEELDPWFRGVADATYSLMPGFFRIDIEDVDEDDFRHEFRLKAPRLLDHSPGSDWDWYFIMQHYGLPTRLLDWTEGALIALYFALYPRAAGVPTNTGQKHDIKVPPRRRVNATGSDSAVWILNPWKLNKLSTGNEMIYDAAHPAIAEYLPPTWSGKPLPEKPLALQPTLNSPRIIAQRGMFTIHGSARAAIEEDDRLKSHLWRIDIANESVNKMRSEIWRCGITESTIFPELAGLCREIKDFWTYSK